MKDTSVEPWIAGQLALSLLAVDPHGLKGLHLRARSGPTRDRFLAEHSEILDNSRRITPAVSDEQLFGGVDIAATLVAGRIVMASGLMDQTRTVILSMAERCDTTLAAKLAQVLDRDDGHVLVLLDEGADEDERAPDTLVERVAFSLSLDGLRAESLLGLELTENDFAQARVRMAGMVIPDDAFVKLALTAAQFGIDSLRAPWLALRAAMAHSALMNRSEIRDDDLQVAAQLVFAHRATRIPDEPQDEDQTDDQETPDQDDSPSRDGPDQTLPDDMMIDAVRALLPPDLLEALADRGSSRKAAGAGGAGRKNKGNRRGRPLPSRKGHLGSGRRIDLVATLRAAAPWQPIRRKSRPDATNIIIHPGDIFLRRYEERSDRLVIFAVDASGSAAMARLAEAKGAVELMLANAYAQRDHVALVAFRGEGAELSLPPTRSLVQVKRRLAGLPGGGGTPLAAGLKAVADLAQQARGHGLSPSLALLTDGRANVPLPGRTGRVAAQEDAESMARYLRTLEMPCAVVDTGNRPQASLRALAVLLGGVYLPLPRADADKLSQAIGQALET